MPASTPLFDPAAFTSTPPRVLADDDCTPSRRGTPYSSSSSLASAASTSTPSLSAASSTSGEDERETDCLDLLDQLELEITRLNDPFLTQSPAMSRDNSQRSVSSDWGFPVVDESATARSGSPKPWRSMHCRAGDTPRSRSPSPNSTRLNRSPRTQRRSRRPSFTQNDIADLDIDAILEAYELDGILPSIAAKPTVPTRSPLRPAPSNATIREDVPTPRPASPTPSTASSSAMSLLDERFPHRRVAPFPTIPRPKSSASLRSVARTQRDAPHEIPPVPALPSTLHQPTLPTPPMRRVFTSFPMTSSPSPSASSVAMRQTRSCEARYSTASSTRSSATSSSGGSRFDRDSIRWSVATASTAASSVGDASDDVALGRKVRFDSVDEVDECDIEAHLPELRPAEPSVANRKKRDSCGLISWQDFANELEETLPPPQPMPRPTFSSPSHSLPRTSSRPFSPASSSRPVPPRMGRGLVHRGLPQSFA
ncbi:hypothetical protein BMF94_1258 [Rhodotorula taiwanensis]|uniref:Uncharacterized protein n=1 Tax=Rhodotorula taiwanensis TaxID=741276 RepID=A0A2S5BFT3_9BASI|nr:hypothetical protein BMF94_1258 [Rhodotorula taiwanensis]